MPADTIVIVEDELIEAEDIRQTLELLGYCITGIYRTGESALDALKTSRPDLVLLDLHLAGRLDGIDTAEQVHTLYNIPVIFLTAHADDESLERAKVTEPYGYVIKPFDERELHSSIKMALYKHHMEEQAQENARTIRVLANAIPDAVMLLDENHRIIALNDAMARRIGHSPSITDKPAPVIRSGSYGSLTSLESQVSDVLGSLRPTRFEEKTGNEWFEVTLHPVIGHKSSEKQVFVQYHDITDHKIFEDKIKRDGLTRIAQNMEQFQILNDQIRNPLQAIMGYVCLDCIHYRERILEQVAVIDTLVDRLDNGWLESEKVRRFLLRHYRSSQDNAGGSPDGTAPEGGT